MNINKLFKAMEFKFKRILSILPSDEIKSPQQYLENIFNLFTLPEINSIFPNIINELAVKQRHLVLVNDDKLSNKVTYRISDELSHGLSIRDIRDFVPLTSESSHYEYSPFSFGEVNKYGRMSSASLYSSVMKSNLAYVDLQLSSKLVEPLVWYFYSPNIIEFTRSYDYAGMYKIQLVTDQDPSLISIPEKNYLEIEKLFRLDIQSIIYEQYKHFEDIDTIFGQLGLRISDWSNSESEKDELLTQHKSTAHLRTTKIRQG